MRRAAVVGLVLGILATASVAWIDAGSWQGRVARDLWLAQVIRAQQRGDGFFVFSRADANPPLIAETYFALVSLHELGAAIPNRPVLIHSLADLEARAEDAARHGVDALDGRDLYELTMIHELTGAPLSPGTLTANVARVRQALVNAPVSFGGLRAWYYGLLALDQLGTLSPQERADAAQVAASLLDTKTVEDPPALVEVALLVDLLGTFDRPLTDHQRLVAAHHLARSRAERDAAFASGPTPDMLTTFFGLITVRRAQSRDVVDEQALFGWVERQREWAGYRVAPGTPVSPLGTAYALVLRKLAQGNTIAEVPR